MHIRLDHPSKNQLLQVLKRNFFALDLAKSVDRVCESCHICSSLQKFPDQLVEQSSEDPPETVGMSFAADVLKRNRQLILVVREIVTSYTAACIIENEKHETLREALARLVMELHPLDGPIEVVRVDPAPGFVALKDDCLLHKLRITLEVGRIKNVNKNPVAEKAIQELEEKLLRHEPMGGAVTPFDLSIAVARLNARIRSSGMSSRELWIHRSQFTHEQIPISDREVILQQHQNRTDNHLSSTLTKHKSGKFTSKSSLSVGNLVYLYSDKDKSPARSRYLVVSIHGDWCYIKKFTGNQLRPLPIRLRSKNATKSLLSLPNLAHR